jgi:flagellin
MANMRAMTAMQTLNKTRRLLDLNVKNSLTGLPAGSPEDNAAYWSIAAKMRSDNSLMSTIMDALGRGAATIDVAHTALNNAIGVVSEIKSKLVAARQAGVDRTRIQSEISMLQGRLQNISDSAVLGGENWLSVDSSVADFNATKSIVSPFFRSGDAVTIGTIDVDITSTKLYDTGASAAAGGILDASRDAAGAVSGTGTFSIATLDISALENSAADLAKLESYISGAAAAIDEMTRSAVALGVVKQRVDLEKNFVSALMDAIDRGIGMNEESTKLQALQVQQRPGTQTLSIANQNSQSLQLLLSLFR